MLHNDPSLFEQIILKVSDETRVEASIIEKDYYVTLFLQKLVEKQPNVIFKGGTSLSKCYKLINRFSEDIDLNIEMTDHATEGQRKSLKRNIVSTIDELGLALANPDDVRSRRTYNRYIIDYPTIFSTDYLKENLIVETAVYIKAYPCDTMEASSLICDYLIGSGYEGLVQEHQLQPFELSVQRAERTLIDKVFALCDYYLSGALHEHSRHIYDIYKLLSIVALDSHLKDLAFEVREERRPYKNCHSAKDAVDINALLQEIIDKDIYKQDYEDITSKILFEEVTYKDAIESVKKIIESNVFCD